MRLITNSVSPTQVTETDSAYIIQNVPFVKSMHLSGGYVPEWSIKQTANEWHNKKATLNHPRDNQGKPIPAETKPETHLGEIQDSWFDGEFVRANIKLEKSELQSANAKAVQSALENGEQIHVSSQYHPRELPPGEYDGEYRENVEAIAEPDSVAILPHQKGKCDIQDGCGINPELVANAEVTIPMASNASPSDIPEEMIFDNPGEAMNKAQELGFNQIHSHERDGETIFMPAGTMDELIEEIDMRANQNVDYALTDITPEDVDEYMDSEWDGSDAIAGMPNPSENEDAPGVLDDAHLLIPGNDDARDDKSNWKLPFRTGPDAPVNTRALVAARAAINGARGGVEGVSQADLDGAESRAVDFLVDAPEDMFGSMDDEDDDMSGASGHMEDNSLFDVVANLAGRLFKNSNETGPAESGVDDDSTMDRQDKIEDIVANSPLTKESLEDRCNDGLEAIHSDVMENDSDNSTMSDNNDAITFESEDEFEDYVDEIVANRVEQREKEHEKERLAQDIVANSADYEDSETVLEDFPTKAALEAKQESLDSSGAMPSKGVSANFDGTSDDIDVSSGVLTE
jgi:hypothetical protein